MLRSEPAKHIVLLVAIAVTVLAFRADGSANSLTGGRSATIVGDSIVGGKRMTLYQVAWGAPSLAFGLGSDLWFGTPMQRLSARGRGFYEMYQVRHGDANAITLGPDGESMWFTPSYDSFVGTVNAQGKFKFFRVLTKDRFSSTAIAAGPDGRVWFTAQPRRSNPFVGAISSTGQVQQYQVGAMPSAVARGPNAVMWFGAGNTLGTIASSGVVTTFPVDGPVKSLVNGSDGNMWFCTPNQIGRSNPNGTNLTYYPLPAQTSCGIAMTVAADGNIYMPAKDSSGPAVLEIMPDGSTQVYQIPVSACGVSGITRSSDGAFVYLVFNYTALVVKLAIK